ncbi:MAG: hypothetical protein ACRDM3_04320 [Rubrobacteraceae bacterium]|jgi:hypothetical protein
MLKRLASRFGVSKAKDRNIVLTGPGRSGTTLTCFLLNKLPDTVALSEPISPGRYANRMPDYEGVADGIEEYYRDMRKMALREGLVISKHVGGMVPDNSKGMKDGVRQRIADKGQIPVGKDLQRDFYLAIKQPGMFTALLPTLVKRFPCFAIIRNPLAIMLSTSTLQKPGNKRRKGHSAKAGSQQSNNKRRRSRSAKITYDPQLGERLGESRKEGADKIDQRLMRLHYTFERYQESLPRSHIIRYEDICSSRGKALEVIVPAAGGLDEPLENKNLNPLYPRDKVFRFGEKLLESEGAYWNFYSREDVEEIINGLKDSPPQ